MKTKLMVFFLAFISINTYAQTSGPLFKDPKIAASYADYVLIKEALINSDYEGTKKSAMAFQKSLAQLSDAKAVSAEADKLVSASNIEDQRKYFSNLINKFIPIIREAKTPETIIFIQHCPMAFNGLGADWLANEKEIRNPYFGEKMLKCGSAKELD